MYERLLFLLRAVIPDFVLAQVCAGWDADLFRPNVHDAKHGAHAVLGEQRVDVKISRADLGARAVPTHDLLLGYGGEELLKNE